MFNSCRPVRHVVAAVLLFAFSLTAIGQQSPQVAPTPASTLPPAPAPAPPQTPQMMKVMRSLSRYEEGTKLDIRLTDGSHQIGKVSETMSTYFVFVDSVSGKARNIDYLDVSDMRATGKGSVARQFRKSVNGVPGRMIGLVVVIVVLGVIAIISFRK